MINRNRIAAFALAIGGMLSSFTHPALASGSGTADISTLVSSLGASTVSGPDLAKMRGASGTVAAINLGSDSGNTAYDSPTGSIMNTGSVNDNTGLTSVIQNTGNNALLQSSMTVNISVH